MVPPWTACMRPWPMPGWSTGCVMTSSRPWQGPMAAIADTNVKHEPVESLIAEGQPVVHGD